jgi:hypothetical protein
VTRLVAWNRGALVGALLGAFAVCAPAAAQDDPYADDDYPPVVDPLEPPPSGASGGAPPPSDYGSSRGASTYSDEGSSRRSPSRSNEASGDENNFLHTRVSLSVGVGFHTLFVDGEVDNGSGNEDVVSGGLAFLASVTGELRLIFPDLLPVGAILEYELGWGGGEETTEWDESDIEFENELTVAAHLLDVGGCFAIERSKDSIILYPYVAYTFYGERFYRDDYEVTKGGPPGALDDYQSRQGTLGHGLTAGVQAAFQFGRRFGMDVSLAYTYMLAIETEAEFDSDATSFKRELESLEPGHIVRLRIRPRFELIKDFLAIGARIGLGVRSLRGEREDGVQTYDTLVFASTIGFQASLSF